ncbi:MAG: hypothetical protein DWQ04_15580 [Chloroflexi bacterium]|nr:MAG: hypothetical protein DWQ04_15580 [Chloroflexota bacterium]
MEASKTKPIAFSLSQEELFVILRYLNVPTVMGLNHEVLNGLEPEQIRIVLEAAERALVARGFLKPTGQQRFTLLPAVGGTLVVCAKPQTSIVVTINRPGYATEALFFHEVEEKLVSHVIPASGIHQFTVLPDRAAVLHTLAAILADAPQAESGCQPMQIFQTLISQSREAAEDGVEAAKVILQQMPDTPVESIDAFAAALASMEMSLTIIVTSHQAEENVADGFTLLLGADMVWWLRPLDKNNPDEQQHLVQINPETRTSAIQHIQTLLQPTVR